MSVSVGFVLFGSGARCSNNNAARRICRRQFLSALAAGALPALWTPRGAVAASEYDRYASSYDGLESSAIAKLVGFERLRAEATKMAQGDVLELAVGTGLNLGFYRSEQIGVYVGIDMSEDMLQVARNRSADGQNGFKPTFVTADATNLPFEDASFDSIVDTYSLCTFANPVAALREARRVCRPAGKIILVEHVQSNMAVVATYQDATAEAVQRNSKGCRWNQDLLAILPSAGWQVDQVQRTVLGTVAFIVASPKK